MIKGTRELSARDRFILEKSRRGFTPAEIVILLEQQGFMTVVRSRVYQIIEENKNYPGDIKQKN